MYCLESLNEIALIKNTGLFYHRISSTQLSTLERKVSINYFDKCLRSFYDNTNQAHLKLNDYILWHDVFHQVVCQLYSNDRNNILLGCLIKAVKLKVGLVKKIKLSVFTVLVQSANLCPNSLRNYLKKKLLKNIR